MFRFFAFIITSSILVAAKELTSVAKRSHNHGPDWMDHCWEHGVNHVMDPFCPLHRHENCYRAPEIKNGNHSQNYQRTVGSTVGYYCYEGYFLTGPEVVTCEQTETDAKWSQTPVCNKGCSTPPTVEHGSYSKNYSIIVGSTVSYSCDGGYYLTGPSIVTCENTDSGPQWSQTPICKPVKCPDIPDIEHGFHESTNSTEVGTTVRYSCDNGYAILDNLDTISCVLNGTAKWTEPTPECIETICARPVIVNGVILLPGMNLTTALPDKTVETTTELPFTITEAPDVYNMTTTTEVPDTFNETTTSLPDNSNDTTVLPDTLNATTALPDTTNDTAVDLTDTANDTSAVSNETTTTTTTALPDTSNDTTTAMPDSSNETTTAMQGVTTEVTTLLPDTTTTPPTTTTTLSPYVYITNETFLINDTIIYKCNPGYGIVSTAYPGYVGNTMGATCISTVNATSNMITAWSTTVSCVPECQPVPDVANANYTAPSNTLAGSTVVYTCFPDFEKIGPSEVKCMSTGKWSKLPYCRSCMAAPDIAHGTHNTDYSTTVNSKVSYVCNDGFSMLGLEEITCNTFSEPPYAKWTEPPVCTRACGTVPDISSGTHTEPDHILIGANITYSCLDGFEMIGSPNVVCEASGNWSKAPVCNKVCVGPPDIPNSVISRYTYNETDRIKLVCEERYTLIGNDTLDCNGGYWSTPFPYCQCEIKPIDIVFIIDGSGSLGAHGFSQTLHFVVDMVSRFPIETTNFGLLTFSTGTFLQFYLNEYVNDTAGLSERIRNTSYPTGGTHTYAGLEFARLEMFQEKNGMRPNVSHTAIVVTDGHSDNFNATAEQARLLKETGVTVYSVGVGLTDEKELQLIASNTTYVFTVDNYDTINEIAGPLAGVTCASTHGTPRSEGLI
ncbi:sushi, von Willebrand factor type A, EGF and pentraxin domain-containing protein 1-like [Mercenaria mercenaria]|uniref:sushi, von Willebrand factor type A, EGF and pentraxin domain-containing protein 1-like n=1 Tax=Mercenaria mercenaria TaxID=6596 RepID=UPI00234E7E10|nr:sushi, von Willebrand factor type A, EGF and pentraxin domain-containing protein 1-like [Mercenaria mercenaria]